jgi:glycosyltransferase involved in cell wall biosynthesis
VSQPSIAVILPCYNEEAAIAGVVEGFRAALPDATVYVYDNASSDRTAAVAAEAGAVVRHEPRRGKGNVVRRMFADVDADVYVLADGDGTYDAASAPAMIEKLAADDLDMVLGVRKDAGGADVYRPGHRFGNRLFSKTVAALFGRQFTDILSGYRVMSRRFVKSFPLMARGFEVETEMTVHCLDAQIPVAEVDTPYGARPGGSESKLNSYRDGLRILWTIFLLLKDTRPLPFFGGLSAVLAVASVLLAVPLFITYAETGLVPRFPTAILATGMMILAFLMFACGLILDSVAKGRWEAKRLRYLAFGPVTDRKDRAKGGA